MRRPLPPAALTVRIAAAAVLGGSVALAACSSGASDESSSVRPYLKPTGAQSVRAPGAGDDPAAATAVDPHPVDSPKRPNLLMITVDDAAWKDMPFMPHLRRLVADQGVTLENGLAPTPLCVPARASLLTGKYAHNHGAGSISGENGGVTALDDTDTLPVWLEKAGYRTYFLGKYLNGYGEETAPTYVPPGWTDWRATVDPTTYNFVRPTLNVNGTTREFREYSTTLLSRQSRDLLAGQQDSRRPWYMWVNYVAPHHGGPPAADDPEVRFPGDRDPVKTTTPAPRDENRFDDVPLPHTPDMFEKDPSDKGIVPAARRTVPAQRRAELTEARQQRLEALQAVDRAVAATVRTLRRTGQLRDTYVVFTSDNGYVLGEHNLEGKLWYFRDIASVPMYIRGPGLERGSVSRAPVTNADWAPTFAALAGARAPQDLDGTDVLPWIHSGATQRVVPIEAYPVRGGKRRLYHGIIDGPWTWVQGRGGRTEVYYRRVDRYQLQNLRHDPRYDAQVGELRRLARSYRNCAGPTCQSDFTR